MCFFVYSFLILVLMLITSTNQPIAAHLLLYLSFDLTKNHWTLAVINFRLQRLEYYDSMGQAFEGDLYEVTWSDETDVYCRV